MSLLQTKRVSKFFGGVKAVNEVSIQVDRGSITALIGPNGAGKTTLFNLLTSVYRPTAGEILFDNRPLGRLRPDQIVERGMARTFQNIRLFTNLTVLDNVLIGLHDHLPKNPLLPWLGWVKAGVERSARRAALEFLEFVGLAGCEKELSGNLAYGQQRILEIARALATRPRLLLLDEPAAGMNHTETEQLMALIRKIRDTGVTVLLIEHDMKLVMDISDHIWVLDHGELLENGDPDRIRQSPKVRAAYLGEVDDDEAPDA